MTRAKKPAADRYVLAPKTGRHTKADIEKLLNGGPGQAGEPVTKLACKDILAAAPGVFQWRRWERDRARSTAHIRTLMQVLTTRPLDAVTVFPAGDNYFVIDGHHRLAAYEAVGWDKPVPVEVFTGTLQEACDAALRANHKDKLPMRREDKLDAAWRLVRDDPDNERSKHAINELTQVSNGTIGSMRKQRDAMKAAGERKLPMMMTWDEARRWPEGPIDRDVDGWREQKIQVLMDRLRSSGIMSEFGKDPELVFEALCRLDPDLPRTLIEGMDPDELIEMAQAIKDADHRRAANRAKTFAALKAEEMTEF